MSVSIADVRSWLGESTYGLAELFRSTRVNKWSRYKPVQSSRTDITSRAQYEQMASDMQVCWGFDRSSFVAGTSIADLCRQAALNGADWRWVRPTSGPCRLGDFDGYSHTAQPPCSLSLPSGLMLKGETINLYLTAAAKSGGLGLVDFKSAFGGDSVWNSLRWAVARIVNRDSVNQVVSMDLGGYVRDGAYSWTYTPPLGTFELLVMATNAPYADAAGGAYYYLLIPGGYTSVEVVSSYVTLAVASYGKSYNASGSAVSRVSVTVTLRNRTSEAVPAGFWMVINGGSGGGVISLNTYYKEGTNVVDNSANVAGSTPQKYLTVPAGGTRSVTVTYSGSLDVTRRPEVALVAQLPDGTHYYDTDGTEHDSLSAAMEEITLT